MPTPSTRVALCHFSTSIRKFGKSKFSVINRGDCWILNQIAFFLESQWKLEVKWCWCCWRLCSHDSSWIYWLAKKKSLEKCRIFLISAIWACFKIDVFRNEKSYQKISKQNPKNDIMSIADGRKWSRPKKSRQQNSSAVRTDDFFVTDGGMWFGGRLRLGRWVRMDNYNLFTSPFF